MDSITPVMYSILSEFLPLNVTTSPILKKSLFIVGRNVSSISRSGSRPTFSTICLGDTYIDRPLLSPSIITTPIIFPFFFRRLIISITDKNCVFSVFPRKSTSIITKSPSLNSSSVNTCLSISFTTIPCIKLCVNFVCPNTLNKILINVLL